MRITRRSRRKLSIVAVLSLGFMIFGIGGISWVMFRIQAQSDYSVPDLQPDNIIPHEYTIERIDIYPAEGDNIGSLTIPALKRKLPIIQGTGSDELKEGVGHFTQSVLPGEEDNCVLSGHRETVFRLIGDLKIGDQLIVETSAGTFTYEVSGMRIVHADDKTVIVPTDHAVLTMTTCYPFHFFGNAPDRYILTADLVK